jgi:Ras-related GTP-binding protein C/D
MAAYYSSPQYYDSPASHASESLSSGASPNDDGSSYLPPEDDDDHLLLHRPNSHPIPAVDFDDPTISCLPRILLMGPRRSGKTSIQRVVFHKMSPHETLFRLEATQLLERAVVDHTPLCRFTIWDFPGDQYDTTFSNSADVERNEEEKDGEGQQQQQMQQQPSDDIFVKATALIFVLDAQDEPYDHVLQSFTDTVTRAVRANPSIAIEVFVHKVDGELFLSDEAKYDCRRDVMQQVSDELADAGFSSHDAVPISYHLTSIYDHSVFEAFSRVVQRLIPELPTLEHLLNVLVSTCSMEKAYLFDVASKLYISTDSSPVDMQSVELCSDMIDVVLDVSGIYGTGGIGPKNAGAKDAIVEAAPLEGDGSEEKVDGQDALVTDAINELTSSNHLDSSANENDELLGKLVGQASPTAEEEANDADGAASAYDSESSSTIHLSNGMVLFLKEVDTMLALVCLTRAENFKKKSLINYNIGCLKKALKALASKNQAANGRLS